MHSATSATSKLFVQACLLLCLSTFHISFISPTDDLSFAISVDTILHYNTVLVAITEYSIYRFAHP